MFFHFIYLYILNFFNSCVVFKSVDILNQNQNIKNKTIVFYLSYFSNFRLFNYQYNKIRIKTKENLYKIYTDADFKFIYENSKNLKPLISNKKIISFKINNIEYVEKLKPYIYFDNSVYDFYLFNKPKENNINISVSYQTKKFNYLSNVQYIENTDTLLNNI